MVKNVSTWCAEYLFVCDENQPFVAASATVRHWSLKKRISYVFGVLLSLEFYGRHTDHTSGGENTFGILYM